MHVLLTTPYNPGDADPGVTYARVRVTTVVIDRVAWTTRIEYQWGNYSAPTWTAGVKTGRTDYATADLVAMLAVAPDEADTNVADGMMRAILTKLIADGVFAGTVAAGA